jgi:uncharacterized membrane protein YoaK (UPF0700 family)
MAHEHRRPLLQGRGGPLNWAQVLSIPIFIFAVAATWLLAKGSARRGSDLVRLLQLVQFLLLAAVLVFSVVTKPSSQPHGLMAGVAAMIAVAAMACQYALFRLVIPGAISTAVMTGNLTNTVLSLMDHLLTPRRPLLADNVTRLKKSLRLLFGFLAGCIVAAASISLLGDWAWSIPTILAAVAVAMR